MQTLLTLEENWTKGFNMWEQGIKFSMAEVEKLDTTVAETIAKYLFLQEVKKASETTQILDETLNTFRRSVKDDISTAVKDFQQQAQAQYEDKIIGAVSDILKRRTTPHHTKTVANSIFFRGLDVTEKCQSA